MSGLFWTASDTRLKTFSSTTTGKGRTTFRIELETDDPYAVASMLRQLGEIRDEQDEQRAQAKAEARTAARRPVSRRQPVDEEQLPYAAPLMIEDRRNRHD